MQHPAPIFRRCSCAVLIGLALTGNSLAASSLSAPARLTIKAGTPQTARAWVAARANRYETKFDHALVVLVSPAKSKVRFHCITRGCEFPASDQPDTVTRVDPSTYDVASVKGEAAIKLIVWTVTPENVVVVAELSTGAKQPQVRFLLNER
jgi:hypothetical protein